MLEEKQNRDTWSDSAQAQLLLRRAGYDTPELRERMAQIREQLLSSKRETRQKIKRRQQSEQASHIISDNIKRRQRRKEKETERKDYEALLEKHKGDISWNVTERLKTATRLAHMEVYKGYQLEDLPPWSQIEDNFGIPYFDGGTSASKKNEDSDNDPIVLGLEYCAAFRESKDPKLLGVGPAGMFSTGTNLIHSLLKNNCQGPVGQAGPMFALGQVPYGKHEPADARFYHQATHPWVPDREAILPVVAIRHPYTWMAAMCRHSYNTRWRHVPHKCYESLFLKNKVERVPYAFTDYNETHKVTNSYESLAHMWIEWYKPYFLEQQFNQTPRLMVRHEDLVYRPKKVIKQVCECVGGTHIHGGDAGWAKAFEYEEESANKGMGHGRKGRSGLLEAVIKYARPLDEWYSEFSGSDKEIIRSAFAGEGVDPELQQIFRTFRYKLFDDVRETTESERDRNRERYVAGLTSLKEISQFKVQQNWTDGPPPPEVHKVVRRRSSFREEVSNATAGDGKTKWRKFVRPKNKSPLATNSSEATNNTNIIVSLASSNNETLPNEKEESPLATNSSEATNSANSIVSPASSINDSQSNEKEEASKHLRSQPVAETKKR